MRIGSITRVTIVVIPVVALVAVLVRANMAGATQLPPKLPQESGWQTYWLTELEPTCCGKNITRYYLNPLESRDFSPAEAYDERVSFLTAHAGHAIYRGDATYTFNGHGYAFFQTVPLGWYHDPQPIHGSPGKNAFPCWYSDSTNGLVYRWVVHSAFPGTDLPYTGKCGISITCDHDETIYGTHSTRWQQFTVDQTDCDY